MGWGSEMTRNALTITAFALGLAVGSGVVAAVGQRARVQAESLTVTGIGGVFLKAENPTALREWYGKHLGIDADQQSVNFFWRDLHDVTIFGRTVWSLFPEDTDYFGPSGQGFMINYRVNDLDGLLERLQEQGVQQIGETEQYWYGRFAWILDGEDNRVELWEPVDFSPDELARRLQDKPSQ